MCVNFQKSRICCVKDNFPNRYNSKGAYNFPIDIIGIDISDTCILLVKNTFLKMACISKYGFDDGKFPFYELL